MITRKVVWESQGRVNVYQIGSNEPLDTPNWSYVICPRALWTRYMDLAKNQILTRRDTVGPVSISVNSRNMWTGYAQVVKSDPKPSPIYEEDVYKKKHKSSVYPPPDGAIVMNPYKASFVSVTQIPGEEVLSTSSDSSVDTCFKSLGVPLFATVVMPNGRKRHFLDSRHFYLDDTGIVLTMSRERVTSRWAMPADLNSVILPSDVREKFFSGNIMDPVLIQSAQAEANEKFIDLTTELAELPETVKMVVGGFREIARLVSDFKNKKLSLTKASAKRRAYLKKKFDEDMAKLNLKRKGASKKLLHILDKQKARAKRTYSRMVAESLRELADAIANLWLQFRYGIMPVVYTVESVQDLIKSLKSEYVTTRDKESSELVLDLLGESTDPLTLSVTHRVTIKQRYLPKETTFGDVMVRMSGNFALTLWELIPLSFVVDWFINVGNLLSSLNPSAEWDEEAECYSWQTAHTQRITLSNGSILVIKIEAYERQLIPDDALCGLVFDPNITLFRLFDAIALTWNPVKSLLISSKKG